MADARRLLDGQREAQQSGIIQQQRRRERYARLMQIQQAENPCFLICEKTMHRVASESLWGVTLDLY